RRVNPEATTVAGIAHGVDEVAGTTARACDRERLNALGKAIKRIQRQIAKLVHGQDLPDHTLFLAGLLPGQLQVALLFHDQLAVAIDREKDQDRSSFADDVFVSEYQPVRVIDERAGPKAHSALIQTENQDRGLEDMLIDVITLVR